MKRIYFMLIGLLACAGLWSCDDDFGREYGIPDGESLLTMRMDFRDYTPALRSRGTPGDTIKAIENLTVLVYTPDGTNVLTQRIDEFSTIEGQDNPGLTDKDRPDSVPQAEERTGHAEFKLRLYNGRYRIYAVANYDVIGKIGPKPTEEELKNAKVGWNKDVPKNNAMFGFFATDDVANPPTTFEAPVVAVRGSGTLHAWVRRTVSKLTIEYDGSGLKEGVFVYIKSAQIKDMATDCLLGAPNDYNRIKDGYELTDGDTIKYYNTKEEPNATGDFGPDYKVRVTRGGPVVGSHAEDANSLYFFENIQKEGKAGTVTDKRQDVSGENKQVSYPGGRFDNNPAWKDGRPYGTYVEVKAFYISIAEGHMSSGPITYRFMLGKNTIDNYEAERNYHYKLTMKFKGYANDVDFHIDYTVQAPEAIVPDFFISYLYNHSMYHPVAVSTGKRKLTKVLCEIEENHWWPTGATPREEDEQGKLVTHGAYNPAGVADADSWQWHGFLSLRETKDPVLNGNSNKNGADGDNAQYYYKHLRHSREYSDMTEGWHSKDKRTTKPAPTAYTPIPNNYAEADGDEYHVEINYYKDGKEIELVNPSENEYDSLVYELKVPLYTRAKQMIKSSAYSGNNPYTGFQRGAKLKYTFYIEGLAKPLVRYANITQVRRVVNPKGIYRTENDNSDFYVQLMVQIGEDSETFEQLQSEGKWRAYVLGNNPQIVTLNGSSGTINGSTGSDIKFNVEFTGTHGAAVIRVEYHDYSCQHLIFVRKGSEPMQLMAGGPSWHFTNLRTKDKECALPQEEGSLFKYGNLDYPIDASSNRNDKTPWVNIKISDFKDPRGTKLNMATSDYSEPKAEDAKLWTDFYAGARKNEAFTKNKSGQPGVSGRLATLKDFDDMRRSDKIGYGYGVLYGDGATKCATDIKDVYGYVWNNKNSKNQGMRGIFIYNLDPESEFYGNNIFLPIGNSGYGHRRTEGRAQGGDPDDATGKYDDMNSTARFRQYAGMLKYSARNDYYGNNVDKRPLFYDLWLRPGAIYWLGSQSYTNLGLGDGYQNYLGWDINYFTFDFYGFMTNDLFYTDTHCSACFVRLVD